MAGNVTTDDLLDALREAMTVASPDDAPTAADLAAATGKPVSAIRRALRGLQADGRLDVVMIRRPDLAGRMNVFPAYRIKPSGKKR